MAVEWDESVKAIIARHVAQYLQSDGLDGQYRDAGLGSPCLLLKTTGRRSRQPRITPLIYGEHQGHYVVVASRGGSDAHPAWFLNVQADPKVEFQVGGQKYRGDAREVRADEYDALFNDMCRIFPEYAVYQAGTERKLPVVTLRSVERIETLV